MLGRMDYNDWTQRQDSLLKKMVPVINIIMHNGIDSTLSILIVTLILFRFCQEHQTVSGDTQSEEAKDSVQ